MNWVSPGGRGGGPEAEQVNRRHEKAKAKAGEGRNGGCPESFTRLFYVVWERTLLYVFLGTRQGQGGAQETCVKTSDT